MHPPKQSRRLSVTTPGDSFLKDPTFVLTSKSKGRSTSGHANLSISSSCPGMQKNTKLPSFSVQGDPSNAKQVKKVKKVDTITKRGSLPWEFGKVKTIHVADNTETQKAAIQMQRIARGGWQRLRFRIVWLQHLLDTSESRTQTSLKHIDDRLQQRKEAYRSKVQAKVDGFCESKSETAKEGQQLIKYLQRENKKMREKNAKIANAIENLKEENERLGTATTDTGQNFSMLMGRLKEIEATHKKLQGLIPMYQEAIKKTTENLERYGHVCQAERNIKVLYVKFVGNSVQHVEQNSRQPQLVDEVVGHCLKLEGEETPLEPFDFSKSPLAEALEAVPDEDSMGSEDSENYDDYTLATLDHN